MSKAQLEIFALNTITDDPRFEGFALKPAPSILGRDSLDDDLTPGFSVAKKNPKWKQPRLADKWAPPKVIGRVSEFNDYPCVDMILPAFSERAIAGLRTMLEPNGELLPLKASTKTKFCLYNILTISDALDRVHSKCEFWCKPPTTAVSIDYFSFVPEKIKGLSIFRIREFPMEVLVTTEFVERVDQLNLQGFSFTKVWPLKRSVNWRMQSIDKDRENRKRLKKNTVVLIFPLADEKAMKRLQKFEDKLDAKLKTNHLSDDYLGSYEGHDVVDVEYRMFLSCPDSKQLVNALRSEIEKLGWADGVKVCLRDGGLHETDAREKVLKL